MYKLAYPASAAVTLTAADYAKAVLGGVKMSLFSPFNVPFWIIALIATMTLSRRLPFSTRNRLLCAIIEASLAATCVHFVLFPVADGRFYLSEALVAGLLSLSAPHTSKVAGD